MTQFDQHHLRRAGPKCGEGGNKRRTHHASGQHCDNRVWRYCINQTTGERIGVCRDCYVALDITQSGKHFFLPEVHRNFGLSS